VDANSAFFGGGDDAGWDDVGVGKCDGGDGARTGFWGVVGHGIIFLWDMWCFGFELE